MLFSAKKCPALSPPINGYLEPSECALDKSKQYRDVCNFKCNPGYELYGQSTNTTTCTKFGLWSLRGGFQPRCVRKYHCSLRKKSFVTS